MRPTNDSPRSTASRDDDDPTICGSFMAVGARPLAKAMHVSASCTALSASCSLLNTDSSRPAAEAPSPRRTAGGCLRVRGAERPPVSVVTYGAGHTTRVSRPTTRPTPVSAELGVVSRDEGVVCRAQSADRSRVPDTERRTADTLSSTYTLYRKIRIGLGYRTDRKYTVHMR